jgi:hypothetical protein
MIAVIVQTGALQVRQGKLAFQHLMFGHALPTALVVSLLRTALAVVLSLRLVQGKVRWAWEEHPIKCGVDDLQ